ncbi:PAS domain S-box-containing protein [Bacillus ectoiniformans]|uniref:PAS domain S-box protein n=1 Tax=Bacillus ectoiniformans TaxID=1494429 RepID=UPI00195C7976|nr:PAS domain S-box protein [Bacillus ectoiniformans]MBM7649241.1 PAS domain S-box-containing protein [Bacillus ectoiniformans]
MTHTFLYTTRFAFKEMEWLLENTTDIFMAIDRQGLIQYVNPSWEKIMGFAKKEVAGKQLMDLIHPNQLIELKMDFHSVHGNESFIPLKYQFRTKNGSYKWLLWHTVKLSDEGLYYALATDISGNHPHTLESLQNDHSFEKNGDRESDAFQGCTSAITSGFKENDDESDQKKSLNGAVENVLESMIDGFFLLDENWTFMYVNQVTEQLWRVNRSHLQGQNIWTVFPEMKGTVYEYFFKKSMRNKTAHRFKVYSKSLKKHFEICTSFSPTGLAVHIRDIHEQQVNFERLVESEKQIREITENIREVFCVHNKDMELLYVSAAVEQIWGIPLKDIYKNPHIIIDLVHPEDQEMLKGYLQDLIKAPAEFEYRIVRANQEIRWLKCRHTVVCNDKGEPIKIISISEDITELKQKDILIRKGDKLGVVGQLAAGIAHEIRNPLTTIKGFVQLWSQDQGNKYSDIILSELQRIEFIMNEFLMLAKPHQQLKMEKLNLNTVLEEVITFMEPEALLKKVEIKRQLSGHLPSSFGEAKQIKQVIVNLIKNAIDAMPNGGNITIRTSKYSDQYVKLEVIDEGVGVPKDRIARLGEPFYSNKEKGTGLGLMVSFKIIENHKGTISFESEENKGTKVNILMPVFNEQQ